MDSPRSPVTMTATTKKTMSRSFLIDSLIGGVKHPAAAVAAAVPYHPQLNEYIQFLNRTAVAAATYGYQLPTPTVFSSTGATAGPRFFGYPVSAGAGGFGKDHQQQHHQQQHHHHQKHHQLPVVVKPVPVVATGTSQRSKHHHQPKTTAKKRTTKEMAAYNPGKSNVMHTCSTHECTTI